MDQVVLVAPVGATGRGEAGEPTLGDPTAGLSRLSQLGAQLEELHRAIQEAISHRSAIHLQSGKAHPDPADAAAEHGQLCQALAESRLSLGTIRDRLERQIQQRHPAALADSVDRPSAEDQATLCEEAVACLSRSTVLIRETFDALHAAASYSPEPSGA